MDVVGIWVDKGLELKCVDRDQDMEVGLGVGW